MVTKIFVSGGEFIAVTSEFEHARERLENDKRSGVAFTRFERTNGRGAVLIAPDQVTHVTGHTGHTERA